MNALHTIFCDKAVRETDGKLTCNGIFEAVGADTFPLKVSFSMVTWLNGVESAQNGFTIRILDKSGKIRGTKSDLSVQHRYGTDIDEFLFHFNDFMLASPEDLYIVELLYKDKVITRKTLKSMPTIVRKVPADRGFIDL